MKILIPLIALMAYAWLANYSLHQQDFYQRKLSEYDSRKTKVRHNTVENAIKMVCLYDVAGDCQ